MVNEHTLNYVQRIQALLDSYDMSYVIAGGYPRDIHFGREPKDVDVCVAASLDIHGGKKLGELADKLYDLGRDDKRAVEMNCSGEGHDRILEVIPMITDIDVILWNEDTTKGILERFDYNINQFILEDNKPVFKGSDYGKLVMIRDLTELGAVSEQRIIKMEELASTLGWDICEKKNLKTLQQKMT